MLCFRFLATQRKGSNQSRRIKQLSSGRLYQLHCRHNVANYSFKEGLGYFILKLRDGVREWPAAVPLSRCFPYPLLKSEKDAANAQMSVLGAQTLNWGQHPARLGERCACGIKLGLPRAGYVGGSMAGETDHGDRDRQPMISPPSAWSSSSTSSRIRSRLKSNRMPDGQNQF